MTMIARYYEQESQAQAARQDLLNMGFGRQEVTLIEPAQSATNAFSESQSGNAELESRAMQASVLLGVDSGKCLNNLRQGRTLLVVKAGFGYARQATYLVDRHNPIAEASPGEAYPPQYHMPSESAAPLSELLGLKVLTENQGASRSFLGLPTLVGNRSFLTGALSSSNWALTSIIGLLISSTPWCSLIKAKSGSSWTRSFGFRMLSDNATPFSSFFGVSLLTYGSALADSPPRSYRNGISQRAAPLSSLLRWGPLSKNPISLLSQIMPPLTNSRFSLFGFNNLSRTKSGSSWTRSFGFSILSDDATPFSSFFGITLLSDRNTLADYSSGRHHSGISQQAAPLSRLLMWKPLAARPISLLSRIMPPLTGHRFTLFGSNNLSSIPAPLSSLTGMPIKSGKSGGQWKTSLGFNLLSDNSAPLSNKLGWTTKSDYLVFYNPTLRYQD
ncbi:MAG: hypothetical protein OXD01_08165 [Gammaproteobacteria bacterium]|nr:hypothetical protein [Gammaproteobacteria bacterium]